MYMSVCKQANWPIKLMVTQSIKFTGIHLYTWMERGTVRVKCLAQEHSTTSLVRARIETAASGVKCTNHKATTPPK